MERHRAASTLGELVRHHRYRAGLTQRELARRAGVSIRTLRYIEQGGVTRPHATSVGQLAGALGLSDDDREALLGSTTAAATPDLPQARVGVLGPLTVRCAGVALEFDSAILRNLLGLLALQPGRTVTAAEIVDVLWGESPPRTCLQLIHTYIGQLRRVLEPERRCRAPAEVLRRTPRGYRLDLSSDRLDLAEFDDLVTRAGQARAEAGLEPAWHLYAQALACWHGPLLAGADTRLRQHPAAVAIAHRRVAAAIEFADLAVALGRADAAIDQLRALMADEPLDERLAARLVLALAGSGQQAAALERYETTRRLLDAELGVQPGPELRDAHVQVLRGQVPAVVRPAAGEAVQPDAPPAQLPADVAAFTGRTEALCELDALLPADSGAATDAVVVISTIAGTGGVGKTALAVHWAHRVRDRYPDGQLFVDLRGHAVSPPLRPLDALAGFLRALGVPPHQVPDDLDQAAALYRSRLAGRRVLVLLDNAAGAGQVRPLLPGSPGSLVVVTGRDRMTGLVARNGGRRVSLDVLAAAEAVTLLDRLIGADRAGAEPGATAELAQLCGYLPLALRIAAANLAQRPRHGVRDYVARLRAGNRLLALAVDGDTDSAVRATFDLSYRALAAAERRMFRLLGLVPGPDITVHAAAALAGIAPAETEATLDRLAAKHLVDEHAHGRYALHDLLRLYAAELAAREESQAERQAAIVRLADHYLHSVCAAADIAYPHLLRLPGSAPPSGVVPVRFADSADAVAWLDAEQANLVAIVTHLAEHGHRRAAWLLADALHGYFKLRGNAVDWQTVAAAALAAASAGGDQRAQASARFMLATQHDFQSRFDAAIEHYCVALELARRSGWTACEAANLNNLGIVHWRCGRTSEAIDHFTQALAANRRVGRLAGLGVALANLGIAHAELWRRQRGERAAEPAHLDQALAYLREALASHRDVGDYRNEGRTLLVLAAVNRDAGRHVEALDLAERALAVARDTADRRFEAEALNTLGTVHSRLGQSEPSLSRHYAALALVGEIGDRQIEGTCLVDLAGSRIQLGAVADAVRHLRRALTIATETGSGSLERDAQALLATVSDGRGRARSAGPTGRAEAVSSTPRT